jgi:hypothetical protein
MLPYIQIIVLVILFGRGVQNPDTLHNLGFILFFVVYTAYIKVYRKTSVLLILFIGFFILGQYFTSLFYKWIYAEPVNLVWIDRLYKMNMFPRKNLKRNGEDPLKDPFMGNVNEFRLYWTIAPDV